MKRILATNICATINERLCVLAATYPPNLRTHEKGWRFIINDLRTTLNIIESLVEGDRSASDALTLNLPHK